MGERAYFIDVDNGKAYYSHWGAIEIFEAMRTGNAEEIPKIAERWKSKAKDIDVINVRDAEGIAAILQDWDIEAGIIKRGNKWYVWLSTAPYTDEEDKSISIVSPVDSETMRAIHAIWQNMKGYIHVVTVSQGKWKLSKEDVSALLGFASDWMRGYKDVWLAYGHHAHVFGEYLCGKVMVFGW